MISLFVGIGLLFLLLAIAFVLFPLLRHRNEAAKSSLTLNTKLFESKVLDLKADRASGVLSEQDYAVLVHELERDLLANSAAEQLGEATPRHQLVTVLSIAALIPVSSIFLYMLLGNPGAILDTGTPHPVSFTEKKDLPSLPEMIERLEKRLQENPDDPQGWVFLGRTYSAAGRMEDSVKAYQKAKELAGDNPDILADLAETMAVLQNYSMGGEPAQYIEQVLTMAPDHQKGLWLGGTAAFQAQNYKLALERWLKLLSQMPPQGEDSDALRQYVQDAINALPKEEQQAYRDKVPAPLPSIAAATGGTSITTIIRLSPQMQSRVNPDDVVFVFARAVNGPKAPLAITKLTVKELPATITLDESMAMMPDMSIAKFDQVIVGARVSKSGQPIAASGDIEGLSDIIEDRSKEVTIEIANPIP